MNQMAWSSNGSRQERWLGFTLLEMLIAVAIVGLLSSFAAVTYAQYIDRAYRDDAMRALEVNAGIFEQARMRTGTYQADVQANAQLIQRIPEDAAANEARYTLEVTILNNGNGFLLTATPRGDVADSLCGVLTLNNIGVRTSSRANATSGCW